jgi:hypothetical protein
LWGFTAMLPTQLSMVLNKEIIGDDEDYNLCHLHNWSVQLGIKVQFSFTSSNSPIKYKTLTHISI